MSSALQQHWRRSRAGRPRIPDTAIDARTEHDVRKKRMREAQRKYRTKKADTLVAARDQVVELESSLRGILHSYKTLHESLVQSFHPIPTDIALQVSKTALDISRLSRQHTLKPSSTSQHAPYHNKGRISRMFAERLTSVGIQRTVGMLAAAGSSMIACLAPGLLAHANIRPEEVILAQTLVKVAAETSHSLLDDVQFTEAIERVLPPLFRQIEGNTDLNQRVTRLPMPLLQCLQYGRTRTVVQEHPDLPELAGEWLEAGDVEEYLAERGIALSDNAESGIVRLRVDPPLNQVSDVGSGGSKSGHQYGVSSSSSDATYSARSDLPEVKDASTGKTQSGDQHEITVSIDKLIEALVTKTVCLGLCAGIKREGVDEAIRASVIQNATM